MYRSAWSGGLHKGPVPLPDRSGTGSTHYMKGQAMCRVHLCNRKAVPNSNLCDGHYRQLVDRALAYDDRPGDWSVEQAEALQDISESEARVMDGNR